MLHLDENAESEQDYIYWTSLPPLDPDYRPPKITGKERVYQKWLDGTRKARELVQAPVEILGEQFVGITEAAKITGYSTNTLRVWVKSGELIRRDVRYLVRPRHEGDRRAPVYINRPDLSKIMKRRRDASADRE